MHGTGRHIHAGNSPCLYAVALFASFCLVLKNPIKSARQLSCPATKMRLVLMKKVYEDMCDEDRFASDRVLRRRALQSYLLYDARGTAAIFGLPGKSTGEGSNLKYQHSVRSPHWPRAGLDSLRLPWIVDPNLPRFRDLYSGSKYPRN